MEYDDTLISIIIPLFNKEEYIGQTISTALSQTYANIEVIVVDDGSTDNSCNIVKSFTDARIKYFHKNNNGVSSARNYGIQKAKGEWLIFLDGDDMLSPNALEKLHGIAICCNERLDIITGNYKYTKNNKVCVCCDNKYKGIVPDNFKWYFFNRYTLRAGCALINKHVFKENIFDERLSRFEDLEFILRILGNATVYTIPDVVMEYNNKSLSLSKIGNVQKHKDYTFSMCFNGKPFCEKCKLGELLMLAFYTYPNERKKLLLQYKWNVFYALIAKIKTSLNKRRWKRLLSLCCCSSRK